MTGVLAPALAAIGILGAGPVRTPQWTEVQAQLEVLSTKGDAAALWTLCKDFKPGTFKEDPTSDVTLTLCRARALRGMQDREKARLTFEEVIRVGARWAAQDSASADAVMESRQALATLAEEDYAAYPLCLRDLGMWWGSRAEAEEKLARFRTAEQAYKELVVGGRRPWSRWAGVKLAALHLRFFQEVSGRTAATFRGLRGPPPQPKARIDVAQEALRLVMDPAHSPWPRALRDVAQAAHQRVVTEGGEPQLVLEAEQLVKDAQALSTPPTAPVTSPFPPRQGEDRGWLTLTLDGDTVVAERRGQAPLRATVPKFGVTLMDVLRGGRQERFAPDAAIILGRGGHRAALPLLLEAVGGTDEELAVAAVYALGELGTAAHVRPLVEAFARSTPHATGTEPYATPALAVFGMRERILEALVRIGTREPAGVQDLARQTLLPRREAAYVLWLVGRKELRAVYQQLAQDVDDATATYGVLGLTTLGRDEAREGTRLLKNRKGAAACWGAHLEPMLRAMPRTVD
jgi:hypothetical protein